MKNTENNIDQLFNEKLSGLKVPPPDNAWDTIQSRIESKKNRKLIVYWSAAASILILAGLGLLFQLPEDIEKTQITVTQSNENASSKNEISRDINEKIVGEETFMDVPEEIEQSKSANQIIAAAGSVNNKLVDTAEDSKRDNPSLKGQILLSENYVDTSNSEMLAMDDLDAEENIENKVQDTTQIISSAPEVVPILNVIADNEFVIEDLNTEDKNRLSIGGHMTPLYSYRNLSGENASYYNESETPLYAYSGGVNVTFRASKRLSISSGVYYSQMGQQISNNQVTEVISTRLKSNSIYTTNSTGDMVFQYSNSMVLVNQDASFGLNAVRTTKSSPEIKQTFEFIEIPLLARYRIIDRKLYFSLISGLSANILVDQQATLSFSDGSEITSAIENLNTFNYGSAVGLGMGYNVFQNVNFSLEPLFKYYFSSINSKGDIESHPWSVGIYTGLTYSF